MLKRTPNPRPPYTLVVGAACFSVTSHQLSAKKQSSLDLGFGGTGFHLAINLSVLKSPTTYMGALRDRPISEMIRHELIDHGVRLNITKLKTTAVESELLMLLNGQVETMRRSDSLSTVTFDADAIETALTYAHALVLDDSLSDTSLMRFGAVALDNGIPVFQVASGDQSRVISKGLKQLFCTAPCATALQERLRVDSLLDLATQLGTICVCVGKDIQVAYPNGDRTSKWPLPKGAAGHVGVLEFVAATCIKGQIDQKQTFEKAFEAACSKISLFVAGDKPNLGQTHTLEEHIQGVIEQSQRDPLTSVLNRQGLETFLERLDLNKTQLSSILVDVDYFKKVNDTYGHQAGDEALAKVAQVIQDTMRDGDVVGRYGGEEFLCLLRCNEATAKKVAERIRANIEKTTFATVSAPITISAGVAHRRDYEPLENLFNRVDKALYMAKGSGRNKVVVDSVQ